MLLTVLGGGIGKKPCEPNQGPIAELLENNADAIGFHLKNVYQDGELEEMGTTEDYSVVQQEGKRLSIHIGLTTFFSRSSVSCPKSRQDPESLPA